jgi:hypothetical protein
MSVGAKKTMSRAKEACSRWECAPSDRQRSGYEDPPWYSHGQDHPEAPEDVRWRQNDHATYEGSIDVDGMVRPTNAKVDTRTRHGTRMARIGSGGIMAKGA